MTKGDRIIAEYIVTCKDVKDWIRTWKLTVFSGHLGFSEKMNEGLKETTSTLISRASEAMELYGENEELRNRISTLKNLLRRFDS